MPSNALGYSYYSSSGFRNGSVKWQLDRFGLPKCLIFVRQIEKQSKMRNEFTISIQFKTFGYLAFQLQHHTTPTGDGLSVLCFIPTVSVDSTRCPLPNAQVFGAFFRFLTAFQLAVSGVPDGRSCPNRYGEFVSMKRIPPRIFFSSITYPNYYMSAYTEFVIAARESCLSVTFWPSRKLSASFPRFRIQI